MSPSYRSKATIFSQIAHFTHIKCFYTCNIGRCAELDCGRLDCGPFDLGAVPLPWLRFRTSGLFGRKRTGGDKKENRWRYVISPASCQLKREGYRRGRERNAYYCYWGRARWYHDDEDDDNDDDDDEMGNVVGSWPCDAGRLPPSTQRF